MVEAANAARLERSRAGKPISSNRKLTHQTPLQVTAQRLAAIVEDCEWMARSGESLAGAAARLDLTEHQLEVILPRGVLRRLHRAGS